MKVMGTFSVSDIFLGLSIGEIMYAQCTILAIDLKLAISEQNVSPLTYHMKPERNTKIGLD